MGSYSVVAALSGSAGAGRVRRPASAILFDRDGTLIVNVAHNADPAKVVAMPTAADATMLARTHRIPMAVVTNQSVLGRGWATPAEIQATNAQVELLLGPIGPFFVCPHAPYDDCSCRKPKPRLLLDAAAALGVDIADTVMIGDRATDTGAAAAAGARAIMVPSPDTPVGERAAAGELADTLLAAVQSVLATHRAAERR